jgi:integrase
MSAAASAVASGLPTATSPGVTPASATPTPETDRRPAKSVTAVLTNNSPSWPASCAHPGHRSGYAWSFLATTGCRRGEMLGLRWSDVDLDAGVASIRQQVVPLPKASGRGREGRSGPGDRVRPPDRRDAAGVAQGRGP